MLQDENGARRNAIALAGLRIAVGCLFLIFAQYKVFGTKFTLGGGFQSWINRFLQEGATYPCMVPVLQRFVLPHGTAIAFLAAYGELAMGSGARFGHLRQTCKRFRPRLHAHSNVVIELSRSGRAIVGVFRRRAQPPRFGSVLYDIPGWPQ
jgi:hypothetical protein